MSRKWIPQDISQRPKRPYRAPIRSSFFNQRRLDYVRDLLSQEGLKRSHFFNPAMVGELVKRVEQGAEFGETNEMALVGIISTQLVHQQFVENFKKAPPLSGDAPVKVRIGAGSSHTKLSP